MSTVGDILSTVGGVQYGGDTILCYLSSVGDIMIHVGVFMSTVSGVQYHWGTQITKDFLPHRTEHPPPRYS